MRVWAFALVSVSLGMLFAGCKKDQSASSSSPNTSAGSPVAVSSTETVTPIDPTPDPVPATPAPIPQTTATGPIGNPLNMPGSGLDLSDSQRTAVRVLDLASVNQAIQMFYVEEDRYPRNLDELIEKKYFARLPAPPRGSYYQYNPETGQLRIIER